MSVLPPQATSNEEQAYYDESERVYGSWFASAYDATAFPLRWLRRRVAQLAGVEPGMRVLDVATGTGAQARSFAEARASVVGIDISEHMLAIARRKTRDSRVTFIRADATALPEADASFDVACVSFALHEMPPSIRARSLAELVRVTRPGGTIVIVDFGLPRNRLWRALVVPAISLFERTSYAGFVHSNLREALERVGITVREDRRAVLGVARVVIGTRTA